MSANDGIVIMGVNGLLIGAHLGRGIQVEDTPVPIFLTNDKEVLKRLLSQQFIAAIGTMESNHILAAGYALYANFNLKLDSDEKRHAFLHGFIYFSKSFFDALWFLRDNAVDSELAFLEYSPTQAGFEYASLYFANKNFNSQGRNEVCEFSVNDIKKARGFYKSHLAIDIQEIEKCLQAAACCRRNRNQGFAKGSPVPFTF
jgi:hypothetical protein